MQNILLNNGDSNFLRNTFYELHQQKKLNFKMYLHNDNIKNHLNEISSLDVRNLLKENIQTLGFNEILGSDLLKYLEKNCYSNFSGQLDRLSIEILSQDKKEKLFKRYIIKILNILKTNNISVVFFQTTPHLAFDFLLYHIANFKGIKTLIFFRTFYENLILVSEDYRVNKFKPLLNTNPYIKNSEDLLNTNSSIWYNLGKKLNLKNKQNIFKGFISFIILLIKKTKYIIYNKQINSFHFLNGKINIFYFIYLHFKHLVKTMLLKKKYIKNCKNFELKNEKYVFFAMHNQPEKTTNPEGEEFDNNFKAINFLRKIVDINIKILVKEHPKQLNIFSGDVRQLNFRDSSLYSEILKLQNVFFIPTNTDPKELINNSILNCTISGSVAWESALQNKPAITFGNTWHSDCVATPVISREIDIAIEQLRNLTNMSESHIKMEVKTFLKTISNKFFNTTISDFEIENTNTEKKIIQNQMKNLISQVI